MGTDLYERDFVAWTKEQAAELRRLREVRLNTRLDLEQLAEEVEDLGNELRFALRSHVGRIIEHLLKIELWPATQPRQKWRQSVRNARDEAEQRLTPTLRRDIEERLPKLFSRARQNVADSLEFHREHAAAEALSSLDPYTIEQILDPDWWPPHS